VPFEWRHPCATWTNLVGKGHFQTAGATLEIEAAGMLLNVPRIDHAFSCGSHLRQSSLGGSSHSDHGPLKRGLMLHDRDATFSDSFRDTVIAGGVKPLKMPARSLNLNSFAERWVRSVKEECL
jgi:hypothetical protein